MAGFSAAVPRSNVAEAFKEVAANPKKVNDQLKLLWVGCGTADSLFAADQAFWLPATMRLAHGAEIAADSFAWAALLVLLLVRPVPATDPGGAPIAHAAAA